MLRYSISGEVANEHLDSISSHSHLVPPKPWLIDVATKHTFNPHNVGTACWQYTMPVFWSRSVVYSEARDLASKGRRMDLLFERMS